MSVTRELLDALKACDSGLSDYRVAKIIAVGQSTMTKYNKEELSLSAEKVILICNYIGKDALPWLIKLQIERAKCTAELEHWNDALNRLAA